MSKKNNPWVESEVLASRRFDDLAKGHDVAPPIYLAARGLNEVIFSDDVLHVYEQLTAIREGLAEHPLSQRAIVPALPVPTFGMEAEERKALEKEVKQRKKAALARTWKEA